MLPSGVTWRVRSTVGQGERALDRRRVRETRPGTGRRTFIYPMSQRPHVLPPRLGLVGNAGGRELRLVLEPLAAALVVAALFHGWVGPALRSFAPAVFGPAVADAGVGPSRTALGWVRGALLLGAMGACFYYRLYYTALGEELREKYLRPSVPEDRPR